MMLPLQTPSLVLRHLVPGDTQPKLGAFVLAVAERRGGRLLGHVGFSPLDGEVEVSNQTGDR